MIAASYIRYLRGTASGQYARSMHVEGLRYAWHRLQRTLDVQVDLGLEAPL